VVVGVSVGALNSAVLGFYEKGDELAALDDLERIWTTNLAQDLWKPWPYTNIMSAIWEPSFLDSSPLHEMVALEVVNKTFHRKVAF